MQHERPHRDRRPPARRGERARADAGAPGAATNGTIDMGGVDITRAPEAVNAARSPMWARRRISSR